MSEPDPELEAIRAKLRAELQAPLDAPATAPPLDRPVDLDEATFTAFLDEHDLVVVDFWAVWCGPCRFVDPIVKELAREMAGRVAFGKVDTDAHPRLMHAFGIQGIPTLLVFKQGRLVDRLVGAMPKPQLAAALARHAARSGSPGPRR